MGNTYSSINLYFNRKGRTHGNREYDVKTSQEIYKQCPSFEVFTHEIDYLNSNPRHFKVILYDGINDGSKGSRIFDYLYPTIKREELRELGAYYSILLPKKPLVISFLRRNDRSSYKCIFNNLLTSYYYHPSQIPNLSIRESQSLKNVLLQEYSKINNNKIKFLFWKETMENVDVTEEVVYVNDDLKRHIYTPNPKKTNAVLGSNNLLAKFKRSSVKSYLDSSYLTFLLLRSYDGIIVYATSSGIPLVIEFVSSCNIIHIQRQDKHGTYWVQDKFKYTSDKTLEEELISIHSTSKSKNINTYMLDKFDDYNDVTVTKGDGISTATYTKHTHRTRKPNRPNLVFEGKGITLGTLSTSGLKTKTLDVYYLNVKKEQGELTDEEPFLVVLKGDGAGSGSNKQIYHFNYRYGFANWEQFKQGQYINDVGLRLQKKLEQIEAECSRLDNMYSIRAKAYIILTAKDPEAQPEPEAEAEVAPEEDEEDVVEGEEEAIDPSDDTDNNIIIVGIGTGGTVAVAAVSAGGYLWHRLARRTIRDMMIYL